MSWKSLYFDTRVKAADGFCMARLHYDHTPASFKELAEKMAIIPKTSAPELYRSPSIVKGHIIHFLKTFASGTFCISHYINNYQGDDDAVPSTTFLVGFRDERDLFKFILKVPNVRRTRWWKSDANFTVLGKDDDFEASSPEQAWNQEDPYGGGIR